MTMQSNPPYFLEADCQLDELKALTEQSLEAHQAPTACTIEKNIPIYQADTIAPLLQDPAKRLELMAEWANILRFSAGVVVIKGAATDLASIDQATRAYEQIIAQEKEESGSKADHFAAAGSNDRIWNSLQKLCLADPDVFARYFANPAIHAVCEAWLGPNYQMSAQVNLVHPGGSAQEAHRDYHLGFQTAEISAHYPAHVHDLSPVLTLQGALAHVDMPVESGPTKLLPFSQAYRAGYAAWRRDDFRAYFEEKYVQLPLEKGDAVFFNPALLHAAGANGSTDIHRFVNLFQVSSAFGRAMESIDRLAMSKALYPALLDLKTKRTLSADQIIASVACCAEGYSFPTNLDRDPPIGGLAPKTQQQLMLEALDSQMLPEDFDAALEAQANRQLP
jgi:ectoine hydroxylase-related dioxygenase (phytanoyl-CoA dioxygenase family)